jgi:CheY-like chemotaxis protein
MSQVLMNLCLNARDAMPSGGRLVVQTDNVEVDERHRRGHLEARTGSFIRMRVEDTGHGIPPELRARIFEPFFTTKEPGKGTGLGLAMVFGIVKQHQGWVECESEPGQGARFDIYLPRSPAAGRHAATAAARTKPSRGSETILLVDDELSLRNLGRAILERYGYQVLLAENGIQALEIYRDSGDQIDLVILDLTMPRLSGVDTLRQLMDMDPDIRVILASGYSAEHVLTSKDDRTLGFISKPYCADELANAVRAALDRSTASQTCVN